MFYYSAVTFVITIRYDGKEAVIRGELLPLRMIVRAKKRLGQNFLIDKNIQKKIINASKLNSGDIILELGSGRGELTCLIAERVKKVYALEIDPTLCAILKENLKNNANVELINQDILKFNLEEYLEKAKIEDKVKVVGNIPYYISSPILQRLIDWKDKINVAFLTVQKEFARRAIAQPGEKDYSSLSCFLQYYSQPRILFRIKKTSFYPLSKVDSCFLELRIRNRPSVSVKDEHLFFKIIRLAFNQRRKTLRNSLKGIISQKRLESFFKKYNLDVNIRPERLAPKDFAELANL